MSKKTIKYLRDKEWTMGNGQCDDCCGTDPNMIWGLGRDKRSGHEKDCPAAKCLEELGEKVFYKGDKRDPDLQAEFDKAQSEDDIHWKKMYEGSEMQKICEEHQKKWDEIVIRPFIDAAKEAIDKQD